MSTLARRDVSPAARASPHWGEPMQMAELLVQPGEFFVLHPDFGTNTSAEDETWMALIETVTTR